MRARVLPLTGACAPLVAWSRVTALPPSTCGMLTPLQQVRVCVHAPRETSIAPRTHACAHTCAFAVRAVRCTTAAAAMGEGATAAELGAVWKVDTTSPSLSHKGSVEDLQWSPNEATVFASCSVDKTVRIWDTRARGKAQLTVRAHDADVNVINWSKLVSYLMVSGSDDGSFKIWDLRNFKAYVPHAHSCTLHLLPLHAHVWLAYGTHARGACVLGMRCLDVHDIAGECAPCPRSAATRPSQTSVGTRSPSQLWSGHTMMRTCWQWRAKTTRSRCGTCRWSRMMRRSLRCWPSKARQRARCLPPRTSTWPSSLLSCCSSTLVRRM
ncbi:WD40 repeat domain-containing protein [archaeon]|nr:MAG: WD40 repeat domain-containing protein [archaeon]